MSTHDVTPVRPDEPSDVVVDLVAQEAPWSISEGRRPLEGWSYNGTVPGPVIEAQAGDVVEVHLLNRLAEPTTIHWHGIRLPAPMDGTESTQHPVEPGACFTYRFRVPDAGTFWYHPHANETVQLERGLYGALVVRGPDEPVVDAERVLVLDDVRLTWRGRIAPPGGVLERHNGREGRVRLLNGRAEPELDIPAGHVERWRIVNVASARYVRLALGGRSFSLIGSDGGLVERPFQLQEILLTPGDRADILVGPFEQGEVVPIQSLPYDRGLGRRRRIESFGTVRVTASEGSTRARVLPDRLRSIQPLASPEAEVTREIRLGGRMSLKRGVDFVVNGEMHHHAPHVHVGSTEVWDVINETPLDHPFHLHGFFFQVLSVNGVPPAYRSWEDTVNVPARGRVRVAWYADARTGSWMYHCHILEHHAAGMMAHFEVVP